MLTLAALADPTRRQIVEMLASRERTAGEIVGEFEMSAPAISQHLKVLRQAGLVEARTEAQRRVYSLSAAGFSELEAWLVRTKRAWSQRLDTLERERRAEAEQERKKTAAPRPGGSRTRSLYSVFP